MRNSKLFVFLLLLLALFSLVRTSQAQPAGFPSAAPIATWEEPGTGDKPPVILPQPGQEAVQPAVPKASDAGTFKPLGAVEFLYSYNFNRPSNGITAFRGFDNRHNSLTLSNLVLGGEYTQQNLTAKLLLQVGHTPNSYYGSEPVGVTGGGAGSSDINTWKYIQEGWLAYKVNGVAKGLTLSAGLFLSPIGPEGMLIKDNFTVSRSNLFFGLPFYHTGARAKLQISDRWSSTLAVYNGWNSVTDNNDGKSLSGQLLYENPDKFSWSLLYFGGPERTKGSPEGDGSMRHLLDTWINWGANQRMTVIIHANAGMERNKFGLSSWYAQSLSGQIKWTKFFHTAMRADFFIEVVPNNGNQPVQQTAAPIFWPNEDGINYVASLTLNATIQPQDNLFFRLEWRRDMSRTPSYFNHQSVADQNGVYSLTKTEQNTLTLAATAWW
jgi:hypothetical protein